MTAKDFLKSKGFDDLKEGLYHVFDQNEIELLLNEFAALQQRELLINYENKVGNTDKDEAIKFVAEYLNDKGN